MTDAGPANLSGQRVVVVGGGVLGTMHAFGAVTRGATVVHLERDPEPNGATVRNFGLVWVSGRAAGRELDLALRARHLWEEVAREVPGTGFRAHGSLTLLRTDAEVEVVERALGRDDAGAREFELLDPDEVRRRNPAVVGAIRGGLWCGRDAAVESRPALRALRDAMARTGRYEFLARRELVGVGDHAVVDHRGVRHGADRVFLCLGAVRRGFAAELLEGQPLRAVQLHMALTAPAPTTVRTAVADGDSLRYYPAFAADAAELLEPQEELAARYGMQLLVQQRLHGGLTIGDTHEEVSPEGFETYDAPIDRLVATARQLLGDAVPAVERRWSGVYEQLSDPAPDEVYFAQEVAAGVLAVTGSGGRGMTLAPAIAEECLA